jgi:hypothetical protein
MAAIKESTNAVSGRIPPPPRLVLWTFYIICAVPLLMAGVSLAGFTQCGAGHSCAAALLVAAIAASSAALMLAIGLILRRAQREHGRPVRVISWALRSQGALAGAGLIAILFLMVFGVASR